MGESPFQSHLASRPSDPGPRKHWAPACTNAHEHMPFPTVRSTEHWGRHIIQGAEWLSSGVTVDSRAPANPSRPVFQWGGRALPCPARCPFPWCKPRPHEVRDLGAGERCGAATRIQRPPGYSSSRHHTMWAQ